jgi:hypothetical protein
VDADLSIVSEKLRDRFGDHRASEIDAAVEHEASRFGSARFRSFVPLLIERRARARLKRPGA